MQCSLQLAILFGCLLQPVLGFAQAQGSPPPTTPNAPPGPNPGMAQATYPQQPGTPQLTLEEIDYRQVAATLQSPLLDEFEDYRKDGVAFADGFAGYMLKKAEHRHSTGTVLFKVGMTLLVMGAGVAIAGVSWMLYDISNNHYIHIGAAASSLGGGGFILISLPFVIVGSVVRQKGKSWVTSLEALIKYRHSVPVDVWASQLGR